VVDFARETVRREPLCHRVGVEERSVNPLGGCTKYAVKFDGVFGHGVFSLLYGAAIAAVSSQPSASTTATNQGRPDRQRPVLFSGANTGPPPKAIQTRKAGATSVANL
jgi:hypothetical protein